MWSFLSLSSSSSSCRASSLRRIGNNLGTVALQSQATKRSLTTLSSTQNKMYFVTSNSNINNHPLVTADLSHPFTQQVRWKRNDGNRYATKVKPPSKKDLKKYHRKLKAKQDEEKRHSKPGSKAGVRREYAEMIKEEMINPPPPMDYDKVEYGIEDAMLDDIAGNTAKISWQPTPEPVYLGHKHKEFKQLIIQQIEEYNEFIDAGKSASASDTATSEVADVRLPSDYEISLALRSFRDLKGTKQRPVGIFPALQFLLDDLNIPIKLLEKYTFTTLMTCAKTPAEGRRVIKLMNEQKHPISSYSWTILVDLYAKAGDYIGAAKVQQEMFDQSVSPSLASYTSVIAACARFCRDGRNAHVLRANAGKLAWEKWKEMRTAGMEPDVLAYGAILQLMAARGLPERALNILEEMQQFQVLPTTLCFTNALRAVARSHSTALRYEQGWSKKNMRRARITLHHGRLAQKIVILAETAQIDQDDGFVAALIMCAASAGDLATSKAIYVASQIRKISDLRTIGNDEHLARISGNSNDKKEDLLQLGSTDDKMVSSKYEAVLASLEDESYNKVPSFGEREYGKDSRILSAIMHACAVANNPNDIGTLWQGRENDGFLCENSLRLLNARRLPKYESTILPSSGTGYDKYVDRSPKYNEEKEKKRKKPKYADKHGDDSRDETVYELDDNFAGLYVDDDGRFKGRYKKTTLMDAWQMKYGKIEESDDNNKKLSSQKKHVQLATEVPDNSDIEYIDAKQDVDELYFDSEERKWKTVSKTPIQDETGPVEGEVFTYESERVMNNDTDTQTPSSVDETEMYFDSDAMVWRNVGKVTEIEEDEVTTTAYEAAVLSETSKNDTIELEIDEESELSGFQEFYEDLKAEMESSGDPEDSVTEEEALELFLTMREEFAGLEGRSDLNELFGSAPTNNSKSKQDLVSVINDIKDDWRDDGHELDDDGDEEDLYESNDTQSQVVRGQNSHNDSRTSVSAYESKLDRSELQPVKTKPQTNAKTAVLELEQPHEKEDYDMTEIESMFDDRRMTDAEFEELTAEFMPSSSSQQMSELEALRKVLPNLPKRRLKKIIKTFRGALGTPSIIDLALCVRERMPDQVTNTWLKKMSALTARHVAMKAVQDGLVNTYMLNSYLEIETSAGSIDRAIDFLRNGFAENNIEPTSYSYRLVIEMLLKNNRLRRALQMKEEIKSNNGTVDLLSYGSLIDYCSRRKQLGSAYLLLKECMAKHNAVPGEAYLKELRILSRIHGLDETLELEKIAGKDPVAWLRDGQANLKREYSKKGNRDLLVVQNKMLHM